MSYLERNSRALSEVGTNVKMKLGTNRGESRSMRFSSVGTYLSQVTGTDVYVGLKEQKNKGGILAGEMLKQRFVFELAVMSVVAEYMPHLLPELPLFYGLLVDKDGTPMAIVTEDFTRDGQDYVSSYAAEPQGFRELFIEGTLEEDFLCNIGFTVYPNVEAELSVDGDLPPIAETTSCGVRRLGDFYPLVPFHKREEHRPHFPEEQIEGELDKHTLKIDYNLR